MADIKWSAPTVGLVTDYLTTTLNTLANGIIDVGAGIDNQTNLCTFMDLEVKLASVDMSGQTNPAIYIYLFEAVDGGTVFDTNEDGQDWSDVSERVTADKICAIMPFRPSDGAEAKTMIKSMVPIPPGDFKLGFMNRTGAALAGTGNTLAYRTYNINSV